MAKEQVQSSQLEGEPTTATAEDQPSTADQPEAEVSEVEAAADDSGLGELPVDKPTEEVEDFDSHLAWLRSQSQAMRKLAENYEFLEVYSRGLPVWQEAELARPAAFPVPNSYVLFMRCRGLALRPGAGGAHLVLQHVIRVDLPDTPADEVMLDWLTPIAHPNLVSGKIRMAFAWAEGKGIKDLINALLRKIQLADYSLEPGEVQNPEAASIIREGGVRLPLGTLSVLA